MNKKIRDYLLRKDCKIIETSWAIWINTKASCDPGDERLCMIDKKDKKIIWQSDNKELELDLDVINYLKEILEELKGEDKPTIEKLDINRNDLTYYDDGAIRTDELVDCIINIKDKLNEIIGYVNSKENK